MEGKLGQADGTQGGRVVSLRERAPLAAVGRSGVLNAAAGEGGEVQKQNSSESRRVGNKSWGYHGKESKRTVVHRSKPPPSVGVAVLFLLGHRS